MPMFAYYSTYWLLTCDEAYHANFAYYSSYWLLTGDEAYHANVATYYQNHLDKEDDRDAQLITDWDNLFWASNVLLANLTAANPAESGSFHQATQGFLKQWVCGSGGTVT